MQRVEDPIKRLRTSLGLNQGPFGKRYRASQSTVSEWERGAPLPPAKAVDIWKAHGAKLRRMGVRFEQLLLKRNGYRPRERRTGRRVRRRDERTDEKSAA